MRKIFVVLVILFLGVYSLNATVYEQLYSYSDAFTYGIGKATVAVDNLGTASFIVNPANVPSKFSFEFLLFSLKLNTVAFEKFGEIISLITSGASDDKIFKYLLTLVGKPLNVGIGFGVLSFNIPIGDDMGISFGGSALFDVFIRVHNPLSSSGFLDGRITAIANPYIGIGYSFKNFSSGDANVDKYLKQLSLGVNFKISGNGVLFKSITIDDIVSSNIILTEEVWSNLSWSLSPDIGILYKLPLDNGEGKISRLNFGLSIKDIGGMLKVSENGSQKVLIPTTFNFGISYFIDLYSVLGEDYISDKIMRENYISLDFHDMFFQKTDKDFFRRIHIGFSSKVFNLNDLVYLLLGFGFNGGYPTFGVSIKVTALKLSYSVYGEELGVYAGQEADIRHVFSVSLGW